MKADHGSITGHEDLTLVGIVDPMVVVDNAANVVSLNPAAYRLFDVKPALVVGQPLQALWPAWLGTLDLASLQANDCPRILLGTRSNDSPRYAYVYPIIGPSDDLVGRALVISESGGESGGAENLHAAEQHFPVDDSDSQVVDAMADSGSDVANVLAHLAWQLGQTAGATSVCFCGWDSSADLAIVLAEYVGPHATESEKICALGTCYVARHRRFIGALRMGQSWEEHTDSPSTATGDLRHTDHDGARSVLYVPLIVRDQLFGWAEICDSRRRRAFSRRTVALAENIARIAAIAIDRAQLCELLLAELADSQQAQLVSGLLEVDVEHQVRECSAELAQANAELLREIHDRRPAETEPLLQENHHWAKGKPQVAANMLSGKACIQVPHGASLLFRQV